MHVRFNRFNVYEGLFPRFYAIRILLIFFPFLINPVTSCCPVWCNCMHNDTQWDCSHQGKHSSFSYFCDDTDLDSQSLNHFCNDATDLDLSWNRFTLLPDNYLSHLSKLQVLNISHNSLSSLNSGVFNSLLHLKVLDISYNVLKVIPKNIFINLIKLEKLYLGGNFELSVSGDIFKHLSNLKLLSLKFINTIPIKFDNSYNYLQNLEVLDLAGTLLNDINRKTFENFQNSHLKTLDISECQIFTFEANALRHFHSLENFISNNLQIKIAMNVSLAVKYSTVSYLKMTHVIPSKEYSLTHLFHSLDEIRLSHLDFSENEISLKNQSVMPYFPILRQLRLQKCNLTFINLNLIYKLRKVKYLDLSNNNIEHFKFYTDPMFSFSNLLKLDLSYNHLTNLSSEYIHLMFPNLKILNLNGNKFNFIENNAFVNASKLQELYLSSALDTQQLTIENQAFNHPVLNTMDLSNNNLFYLNYSWFQILPNIKILDLSKNNLGEAFKHSAMYGVFNELKNLETLNISSNLISVLPYGTFCPQNYLSNFDASHNYLTETVFTELEYLNLSYLYLGRNNISTVPQSELPWLSKLTELDLSDNHMVCNCSLILFQNWIKERKVKLINIENPSYYKCINSNDLLINFSFSHKCLSIRKSIVVGILIGVAFIFTILFILFLIYKKTALFLCWKRIKNSKNADFLKLVNSSD